MAMERVELSASELRRRRGVRPTEKTDFVADAGFWRNSRVGVAILRHTGVGAGLIIGTVLAWFNFRWLRRGLDELVKAATAQAGTAKNRKFRWERSSA